MQCLNYGRKICKRGKMSKYHIRKSPFNKELGNARNWKTNAKKSKWKTDAK